MPAFPPRSQRFLDLLAQRVLVGDGAMGTLLYQRGVALDANFEHLNLIRPHLVAQVHEDYAAAGARVLETNTFGANRLRLGAIGLEHKAAAINAAGARLARQVAGADRFVAGSVGPLPAARDSDRDLEEVQKREILHEQMAALADGGVDLFILETFSSLADLLLALEVAAELGLPASAQLAFLEGGRTREGVAAAQAVGVLDEAGAALIGANCGAGPRDLLAVLRDIAPLTRRPLAAYANSGFPQYRDGRFLYLATPDYFASMGEEMVRSGAALIGGCCGTTPEHIQALAKRVADLAPTTRPSAPAPPRVAPAPPPAQPETVNFLGEWGRRPIITVELDPPRGLNCDKVLAAAERLRAAGVDAISLAENPLARIRLGNLALAWRIQERTGVPVIAHVTCRDRNLIGLHSEMMGAHLLGIRNILAVTGDPVSLGGEAGASSVFDLNSIGLLQLLSALNEGRNLLGSDLDGRSEFLLGAAFNPNVRNLEGQIRRLEKKIAAGARFVQTQPVYSAAVLEDLLAQTAPLNIPVLVGILPLVSERNAEFLHNEVPGITLPDEVRMRMRGLGGAEGIREGLAIAGELIAAGQGRVGGWYLMPPFGKVELAVALMEEIRRRAAG
ncbi:bifunctional homocysteine S-methyltransferase/methylenetetrahydrofolate reductase [Geoalkalibacter halelectricus]|uniref:Bifunctional homocysteine S-methyltransferase/methylenetetrahydrofolate reductase n=1 Tax=Geoalkalibacter halelectricus TaxID=2847045 RepID=A0ABY5ZGU3_9BACT|nr:bifunctional homocysteine S-methyltransferase/methylenetetrahydrofolate reductase [Geoalkalibacter halelectricus]MDO3378032.1 bifunctional homocysteine S-methyltransferase/methylenetetrahydrofolate reductase [Geoalkalibacter halelectricus]UWZ78331.1 bifunctional homocysteine S-methyltransferase/methylenetetrahydrofolate reductase [Geoalkalibacter halelectricus]